MVDSAIRRIDESSLAICQQDVFDTLYSFATTFSKLDAPTKSAVVRAVSSGLSDLVSRVSVSEGAADSSTARNALKMYTYLATEIVADAEAAEKADRLELERERIASQERVAGMQVGAKIASEKGKLSAQQQKDGLEMGIEIASEAAQEDRAMRQQQTQQPQGEE